MQVLAAVADQGGFSTPAEVLRLSKAMVTKHIQSEAQLNSDSGKASSQKTKNTARSAGGAFQIDRVPQHDDRRHQIETARHAHTASLTLAQLTLRYTSTDAIAAYLFTFG